MRYTQSRYSRAKRQRLPAVLVRSTREAAIRGHHGRPGLTFAREGRSGSTFVRKRYETDMQTAPRDRGSPAGTQPRRRAA